MAAAGTDEKKIATINTEYRGRLSALHEAGSLEAGQALVEEATKPLYSTEYTYQALLRQFQEAGTLPSDTEIQEMKDKGMLTGAEASDLSKRRGPDRGQELVKDNNANIEKIAKQVFITEIVQKAGINSIGKLGGKGESAVDTLSDELKIHMVQWANSQENPPSISQWRGELLRRAQEVIKSKDYQIKTKKSDTLGSNFQHETLFVDMAGDPSNRITQAKTDIVVTYGFYQDLGGDKWRPSYDSLLKNVQKALNEPAVGLKALLPAVPAAPAASANASK